MGKIKILSKSSNNSYSYVDSDDEKLTVSGNFEMDEQQKVVLSASGNIIYDGMQIASFNTTMYNGVLQYSVYGAMAENTEKAFTALSGVQEQLKAQVAGEEDTETEPTTEETGTAESATTTEDAESDTDKK